MLPAVSRAEGDLDFRGTLGIDKQAPVGFESIRLVFDLDTDGRMSRSRHFCVLLNATASGTRPSRAGFR